MYQKDKQTKACNKKKMGRPINRGIAPSSVHETCMLNSDQQRFISPNEPIDNRANDIKNPKIHRKTREYPGTKDERINDLCQDACNCKRHWGNLDTWGKAGTYFQVYRWGDVPDGNVGEGRRRKDKHHLCWWRVSVGCVLILSGQKPFVSMFYTHLFQFSILICFNVSYPFVLTYFLFDTNAFKFKNKIVRRISFVNKNLKKN